jgi:hypothetical protein
MHVQGDFGHLQRLDFCRCAGAQQHVGLDGANLPKQPNRVNSEDSNGLTGARRNFMHVVHISSPQLWGDLPKGA